MRGLLGSGDRKSVEPLAARVVPDDYWQVHHFVCTSCWQPEPLERVLTEKAQALVGGPDAVLIIDDTAPLKQGRRSVGVARQYAGAAGKTANCQTLVSLTLAREEVPVCVALRLLLPAEWTDDPTRCRAVGVPEERLTYRTKLEIALAEVDRLRDAGVTWGCVMGDAGYGVSASLRQTLSTRGLTLAVGIPRIQKVYPADVTSAMPAPRPGRHGPPRRHLVPSVGSTPAEQVLAGARWHRRTWRTGTKAPLSAGFAAVRVEVADGPLNGSQHLPGEAAWLVGEQRDSGERRYYLTSHPAQTPLRALAAAIKALVGRAGAQAAQGGAGARPLRGAYAARSARPRAADAHQPRLPFSTCGCSTLRRTVGGGQRRRARAGPPPEPSMPAIPRALLASAPSCSSAA